MASLADGRIHSRTFAEHLSAHASAVTFGAAVTRSDRESCYRLVHDAYVRMGYMAPNPGGIRFNAYLAAPGTATFAARAHGTTVGTMTLFIAGTKGLPVEQVYAKEVRQLRRQGRVVGEVGALAHLETGKRGGFDIFLALAQMCGAYSLKQGLDDILITINPRHHDIYPKLLKFEPFGSERAHPGVKNQPALCHRMQMKNLILARWFNGALAHSVPERAAAMSQEDRNYFEALAAGWAGAAAA